MLEKFLEKLNDKGGIYLKVKVRPGAAESRIVEIMEDDGLKIDIAAAPEKGRANRELIRLIAGEFKISRENVKIISGAGSRTKLISLKINI